MITPELIKIAAEKIAAINWDNVTTGLALAGGIVAATKIADVIIAKLHDMRVEAKSEEYYKNMLENHPQLQRMDPDLVAKYWASLYHFAPYMAEDPLAAGAYITQSINKLSGEEFGGPAPDSINTLTDIQKKFHEGRDTSNSLMRDEARKRAVGIVFQGFDGDKDK